MPLIRLVAEEAARVQPQDLTSLSEHAWEFHLGSDNRPNTIHLRATTTWDVWRNMDKILQPLCAPSDLAAMDIQLRRNTMSAAPARKDYLAQRLYRDSNPFTRMARQKYCQNGILLPFAECHKGFTVPNL